MSEPLTVQLKQASRRIHSISDALVNARLVALFTDRKLYARALSCFYFVFCTLEELLKQQWDHPDIAPFKEVLQGLSRTKGFEDDLNFYLGPSWRSHLSPSKEVEAYQQHLEMLAKQQPVLLLAHAYTQHLAIAAGGQIIRRMARKQMGLPEDQGTAAFEFKANPSLLKNELKQQMDLLGATLPTEYFNQMMIREHCAAFKFNNQIIGHFNIGLVAALLAIIRLVPAKVHMAVLLVLVAVALTWLRRWT